MRPLEMDGFLASIMAIESMPDARAVLHGPGGCRGHTSRLAADTIHREDFEIIEGPFYFNRPRVPCTYVDEEDYVNGADYKVTELLDTVEDANLCVIIPSPGTSLIGDDLHGAIYRSKFGGDALPLEYCHMSEPMYTGYDCALGEVVRRFCRKSETRKDTVSLMGVPILLEGWETTAEEFTGYLEAMGLEVTAVVGGGSPYQGLLDTASAEYCVSVLPEFCRDTMESYARFGVRKIVPGTPLGFQATREWIQCVADATGKDPSAALKLLEKHENRAASILKGSMGSAFSTRSSTYSVTLDSTMVLPLVKWMYSYLSMFPEAIMESPSWDEGYREELSGFLEEIGCSGALGRDTFREKVDVAFGDGYIVTLILKNNNCSAAVDLSIPTRHRHNFVDTPVLGAKGAMRILDDIFRWIQR